MMRESLKINCILLSVITAVFLFEARSFSRDVIINDIFMSDRPYFTSASSPVKKHSIQIETGYSLKIYHNIINHNIGELLARAGVFKNTELRFGIDSYTINDRNEKSRTGQKDGSLGFKLGLFEPDGSSPSIIPFSALTAEARIPTGTPVLRQKAFQPSASVSFAWKLSSIFSLRSSTGYARLSEEDRIFRMFTSSTSLIASPFSTFRTFTEYMLNQPSGYNEGIGHFFSAGLTWRFISSLIFDMKFSLSIRDERQEYIIGAGACGIISFR